jgi:hypothetical protein
MKESHIVIKSSPKRDKTILDLIKTIDPAANYAGGISSSGHRVFIVEGSPEEYRKLLANFIETGVVISLDEF